MAGNAFGRLSVNLKKTVTTAATQILSAGTAGKQSVIAKNYSGERIFVGGTNAVTVASGYPVEVGDELPMDLAGLGLWGITASGTSDIRILEGI